MISVIIIAKNQADLLVDCLKSAQWAREIIVVDNGSTDNTVAVAQKYNAKVYKGPQGSFSDWRNFGASLAKGDWIFYLDVDERITPDLKAEIQTLLQHWNESPINPVAYAVPRKNNLLGHDMRFGGWWPDYVLRLINKKFLIGWKGDLHEQPKIKGAVGKLKNSIYHISHRSLTEMMDKTNSWSEIEAKLLFKSGHPPMAWWRFFSVATREFFYRGVWKLGFFDGPIGAIEVFYQVYSRMITYAKLWEMQEMGKKK
jgi:(heptosyl)LPS beta-1,4-glucosyltransferase